MPYAKVNSITEDGICYDLFSDNTANVTGVQGTAQYLNIPETVQGHTVVSVSFRAFYRNTWILSVTLPKTIKAIGTEAFSRCENLGNVILKAGNVQIKRSAFSSCGKLQKIMGYNVTLINGDTFNGCARLEEIDAIIHGEIRPLTFYECKRLKELYFAENVSIFEDVFKGCMSLEILHFQSNAIVNPDSMDFISKRKIFCNSDCCIADLAYTGTQVVFYD